MERLDVLAELTGTQLLFGDHPIKFVHVAHTQVEVLERAIREHKPHILHFSGYGGASHGVTRRPGKGGLFIENSQGDAVALGPGMLDEMLLESTTENLVLVVLSACHSDEFAREFMRRRAGVRFVVGTRAEVSDAEARSFSQGFYQALAQGETVDRAFRAGRSRAGIEAQEQKVNYVLSEKSENEAKSYVLVPRIADKSIQRGPSGATASGPREERVGSTPAPSPAGSRVTPSMQAAPEAPATTADTPAITSAAKSQPSVFPAREVVGLVALCICIAILAVTSWAPPPKDGPGQVLIILVAGIAAGTSVGVLVHGRLRLRGAVLGVHVDATLGIAAAVLMGYVAWLVVTRAPPPTVTPVPAKPPTDSIEARLTGTPSMTAPVDPPTTPSAIPTAAPKETALPTGSVPQPGPPDTVGSGKTGKTAFKGTCLVGIVNIPIDVEPRHWSSYPNYTLEQCQKTKQECGGSTCRYKFGNGGWQR
jgi:hypothetical protein